MNIQGIDLKKVCDQADKAFAKMAEQRLTDYVRGLKLQAHNLEMKTLRLRTEADQASQSREVILAKIQLIEKGEWSEVDPFELNEKDQAKKE